LANLDIDEKGLEQTRQFFKHKIDHIKEERARARAYCDALAKQETEYATRLWSWTAVKIFYKEFLDIWEFLQDVTLELIKSEGENKATVKERIEKLEKELKRHKPALSEFERIMKEGKQELRQHK
jgi:hypothetical protein